MKKEPKDQKTTEKSVAELWAIEAEKRLNAYKEGIIKTLPYDKVFAKGS
jgi:hypothetical protein